VAKTIREVRGRRKKGEREGIRKRKI